MTTGATGKLGTLSVENLMRRVSASESGVSVREPEKAARLQLRAIRVRRGDGAQPASLEHAFEGASRLLIISSNAGAYGGDPIAQHGAVIQAARQAGGQRIVYTSACGRDQRSKRTRHGQPKRPTVFTSLHRIRFTGQFKVPALELSVSNLRPHCL
jgi:NAD(P)H dehydrogenase (quinone)